MVHYGIYVLDLYVAYRLGYVCLRTCTPYGRRTCISGKNLSSDTCGLTIVNGKTDSKFIISWMSYVVPEDVVKTKSSWKHKQGSESLI